MKKNLCVKISLPRQWQGMPLQISYDADNETQTVVTNPLDKEIVLRQTRQFVSIPHQSGAKLMNVNDIVWIEADGSYCKVVRASTEKVFVTSHNLKAMESLVRNPCFIRIHRSFVVNLQYAGEIKAKGVKVRDKWIPVGREYRSELYRRIGSHGQDSADGL